MFQWLFKRKPRKKVYHCNEDISPAMLECMQLCIERGGAVFGHEVNGRFVEDAPAEQVESAGTDTQQAQPESVTLRKCCDCGVTCDQRSTGSCYYKLGA